AARLHKLKRFIEENNLREVYDFILIDSPPTISLFTDAALVASDYYIVPVKIDHYSILGATSLLSVIENIQDNYDHKNIENLGFIYTNTLENLSLKTRKLQTEFQSSEPFNELYFFDSQLKFVQDLMVGGRGNISSSYKLSRKYIKGICEEFLTRIQEVQTGGGDE
ncbi:TPA: ParA family protein, partial [Enterobacter hormaechei subsp. xiangfangensis]|nr:ParA family protein [Enterobacter hormaechei subsp. xiangfangensis]